jgi:signal transduction histidine kinase
MNSGRIVTDIRRDDQRASNVLQRLRSLLKKAPSEIKDVDLNELAGESIQLLSPLSIAREVKLSGFTAPMSLPIRGDPVQLQQVIVNLIVNAMDAMSKMPRAERRVTVDTARADNFAEVSVSDTGAGIPSEKIKEVFEPFSQQRRRAWDWDCPLPEQSSKPTTVAYGQTTRPGVAQCFTSV